jgi:hypothetical protein
VHAKKKDRRASPANGHLQMKAWAACQVRIYNPRGRINSFALVMYICGLRGGEGGQWGWNTSASIMTKDGPTPRDYVHRYVQDNRFMYVGSFYSIWDMVPSQVTFKLMMHQITYVCTVRMRGTWGRCGRCWWR